MQYLFKSNIDPLEVLLAATTNGLTAGQGLARTILFNTQGAVLLADVNGKNPGDAALTAAAISGIAYPLGSGTSSAVYWGQQGRVDNMAFSTGLTLNGYVSPYNLQAMTSEVLVNNVTSNGLSILYGGYKQPSAAKFVFENQSAVNQAVRDAIMGRAIRAILDVAPKLSPVQNYWDVGLRKYPDAPPMP
jgi:hypothetical protein